MKFLSLFGTLALIFTPCFCPGGVFFSFLLTGSNSAFKFPGTVPEKDQKIHKIMEKTSSIIEKKYGLVPSGIGINRGFKYVEISFQTDKIYPKKFIREILIDCAQIFLQNLNSSDEIREFCKVFPFQNNNIGIVIFFGGYEEVPYPEISVGKWNSEGLTYHTDDPENKYVYKDTYTETHEEAFRILKNQTTSFKKKTHEIPLTLH